MRKSRFTEEQIRLAVEQAIRRLSGSNRARYQQEVHKRLHEAFRGDLLVDLQNERRRRAYRPRASVEDSQESNSDGTLSFDERSCKAAQALGAYDLVNWAASMVRDWLATFTGRHSMRDTLDATDIADDQWPSATEELITAGTVEREGERRGTRTRYGIVKNEGNQ